MTALVVPHEAGPIEGGRPTVRRWLCVECVPCGIILNSGHQYPTDAAEHAHALADEHNAREHELAEVVR